MRHTTLYKRIILLAASVLFSAAAIADLGFFTENAANMHIKGSGQAYVFSTGISGIGQSDANLSGFHRSMIFDHVWTETWHNANQDYFSKVSFYYKVDTWSNWSVYNLTGRNWDGNNQKWETNNQEITIFSTDDLTPGNRTLQFYFKGEAGNFEGERYLSNNTLNYKINFTVPGFVGDDIDFGVVLQNLQVAEVGYTFNSYGWASCTATITDDDEGVSSSVFSFINDDYTTSGCRSKSLTIDKDLSEAFDIYFMPTAAEKYSAKLHLSGTLQDGATITADIPLTGEGLSGDIVVMLADTAKPQNGLKALLSGYLKSTGCNPITSYGFKWGTTSFPNDGESYSYYNYANTTPLGTLDADTGAGTEFETTLTGLTKNVTYYYRAFAENSGNTGKNTVSEEGHFIIVSECMYPKPVNETINVTINNKVDAQPCDLIFNSIGDALTVIKGYDQYYDASNHRLRVNVIMTVINTGETYTETTHVDVTGGKTTSAECIKIEDFNKNNPSKTLVLQGESKTSRATLQHLVIRNSKNITVQNLMITGRYEAYGSYHDNAMDIDNGHGGTTWADQPVGDVANANINIKGCYITSYGFACIHISAYDGITIEDCDMDAEYKDTNNSDAIMWGSSIKLIHCKNIKIIRNSFRGSHATSTWIQGSNNVLLMNNVYWNKNEVTENVAFVRLICQKDKNEIVSNVGMYYNTFYLAAASGSDRKVDFLRLGSWYMGDGADQQALIGNATVANYDASTIDFKYNNCYSYDSNVSGRSPDTDGNYPFLTSTKLADFCGHIDFNNFWSKYDKNYNDTHDPDITESNFSLKPCNTATSKFIDVEAAVCETASSDPSSLVVKTNSLNLGGAITSDVSNQGAGSIYTDRLHSTAVRPKTAKGSGGETSAADGGSILLSVNDNVTTASKDIDVSGFNLTANSTVTCSLTGTNADKFSLSHSTLTVNAQGKLSTMVVAVTFEKPNATGTYTATVNFTTANGDGPLSVSIDVTGKYDSDTPLANGWTMGAYQMSHGNKVSTIVWNGGTTGSETDWDNRNNWVKLDGSPVTCVDLLDEDLTVIIPAPTRTNEDLYPRPKSGTITSYPTVPEKFNSRNSTYRGEIVNAGQGIDGVVPVHYAKSIKMQYGSAMKGVEHLVEDNIHRYNEVTNEFTAMRKKWLVVGTVVQPFDNSAKTEVRNIMSGDYYLNALPQVYMHEAGLDENNEPIWNVSFSSLWKSVSPDKVFAIMIPNEYGPNKLTARLYNKRVDENFPVADATASKTFTFNGWFYNQASMPSYTGLETTGSWVSNTYPANLVISSLKTKYPSMSLYVYNYNDWNFESDSYERPNIVAQEGFLVKGVTALELDETLYTASSTAYPETRGAEAEALQLTLRLSNEGGTGACKATVKYDELKTDVFTGGKDNTKVFIETSGYESVPDLYILRYGMKLSGLTIPTLENAIPLGVKVKQKINLKFAMYGDTQFEEATLTDMVTGTVTNLLSDSYSITLNKGIYEDRFFLNLKASDNVQTVVKESDADVENDIFIAGSNKQVIISSTPGVYLQEAYVTDMAGRTYSVALKGDHYNEVKINGSEGVYIIKAVGDNMSKTEKVIIK